MRTIGKADVHFPHHISPYPLHSPKNHPLVALPACLGIPQHKHDAWIQSHAPLHAKVIALSALLTDMRQMEPLRHHGARITKMTGVCTNVFMRTFSASVHQCHNVRPVTKASSTLAQDLLDSFISFGKERAKISISNKPTTQNNDRFDFLLNDKDLAVFYRMIDAQPTKGWIDQHVTNPGLTVSNLVLTGCQKTSFINGLKTHVIPKELHKGIGKILNKMDPIPSSVFDFSHTMIELILGLTEATDTDSRTAIAASVSAVLLESVLPSSAKNTLIANSALIANEERQYAFFFDPVTQSFPAARQRL